MIKKIFRVFFFFAFTLSISLLLISFFIPSAPKSPLALFRHWEYRKYQKFSESFMALFWENFFSEILYTGDTIYGGTVAGIWVFDARDEKNISLVKKIRLYGRVGLLYKEGNIVYATSGTSGLFTLDVSSPKAPKIIGKLNLFLDYHVEDGAVKNGVVYLAADNGLVVVNAKNPRRPSVVHTLAENSLTWVHLHADKLFVSQSGYGLLVFSLSDPLKPVLVGKLKLYKERKNKPISTDPPPRWITSNDTYLYIANGHDGISVVNAENPRKPYLVSHVKTGGFCAEVIRIGKYVAARSLPDTTLIYDLSIPAHPAIINSIPGAGFPRRGTHGLKAIFLTHPGEFHIADIRHLPSVKILGSYAEAEKPLARDIKVHGDYAYAAYGNAGLKIYKLSPPEKPLLTGSIFTRGPALRLEVSYPHVYVANGVAGTDVIDVRNPAHPVLKTTFNSEQRNWGIAQNKNMLFLAAGMQGIAVYSAHDPLYPVYIAGQKKNISFHKELLHDYYFNVAADNTFVYLLGFLGHVGILDVRQKNSFTVVPFRQAMPQVCDVKRKGDFFYLGYNGGIQIAALDNKRALKSVGKHKTGGLVMALYADERYLYAADYKNGIFVFQTNPDGTLKEIARHKTRGNPRDVEVKDNLAYVADSEAGLTVIDLQTDTVSSP